MTRTSIWRPKIQVKLGISTQIPTLVTFPLLLAIVVLMGILNLGFQAPPALGQYLTGLIALQIAPTRRNRFVTPRPWYDFSTGDDIAPASPTLRAPGLFA